MKNKSDLFSPLATLCYCRHTIITQTFKLTTAHHKDPKQKTKNAQLLKDL